MRVVLFLSRFNVKVARIRTGNECSEQVRYSKLMGKDTLGFVGKVPRFRGGKALGLE